MENCWGFSLMDHKDTLIIIIMIYDNNYDKGKINLINFILYNNIYYI